MLNAYFLFSCNSEKQRSSVHGFTPQMAARPGLGQPKPGAPYWPRMGMVGIGISANFHCPPMHSNRNLNQKQKS